MPSEPEGERLDQHAEHVDDSFLDILKEMRYGSGDNPQRKRKKKVDVAPGKSVTGADFRGDQAGPSGEDAKKDSRKKKSNEPERDDAESNSDEEESSEENQNESPESDGSDEEPVTQRNKK